MGLFAFYEVDTDSHSLQFRFQFVPEQGCDPPI